MSLIKSFILFIGFIHFSLIFCDKNDDFLDDEFEMWKNYIYRFIDRIESPENECIKDFTTLIDHYNINTSYHAYNSRQFFDTWKKGSTMDLWTLEVFQIMADDMKCKLDRPNVTKVWGPNRYCVYEIPEEDLEDGFLFGYCVPNLCDDLEAITLGRVVAFHNVPNVSDKMELEHVTCVTGKQESYGWAFYSIIIILTVIGVLSLVATMLDCPR